MRFIASGLRRTRRALVADRGAQNGSEHSVHGMSGTGRVYGTLEPELLVSRCARVPEWHTRSLTGLAGGNSRHRALDGAGVFGGARSRGGVRPAVKFRA